MTSKKLKNLKIAFYQTMDLFKQHKSENSDGLNLIPLNELFASRLTDNGFCMLPNGLIIQWGISGNGELISNRYYEFVGTFPIAFTKALSIAVTLNSDNTDQDSQTGQYLYKLTSTGFTYRTAFNTIKPLFYIAIGY